MSNKQNEIILENEFEELVSLLKHLREGEGILSLSNIAEALSESLRPEELNVLIENIERIIYK
jgi:hypothetical protein